MEIKDVRAYVDLIRDTSRSDLIIVSLFLVPLLLGAWSYLLNSLPFLDHQAGWKFFMVIALFGIYVVGLIKMKCNDNRNERLRRARYHVQRRLERRAGHRASFEAIRSEVDQAYDDDFLKELIDRNPSVFRTCRIQRTGGPKPGLTLVEEKEVGDA